MEIIESTLKQSSEGYLELILGSMYSGKTSRLIETYNKCTLCNIKCIVINHHDDTRYHHNFLSNHDKQMITCLQYGKLQDFIEKECSQYKAGTIILINEAQFFSDLFESVLQMVEKYCFHVALYGLDGDFERKPFGKLLDLIPFCDNVIKLHSFCFDCKNGTKGIFSKRISNEKEQKVVGSTNYKPLCRKCF